MHLLTVQSLEVFVCSFRPGRYLVGLCRGMSEVYYSARVDIWHPGGFHGNEDNIQYCRHFISAYQSFYMSYSY